MPFTTIDIVKKHILENHLSSANVENERIRLLATDNIQLSSRAIANDSEKIKAKEHNVPIEKDIDFSISDTVTLSHSELIPDTVVTASDSSLGTIYTEHVDYSIDYDSGEIKRLDSGSIPSGVQIVIWYLYYRVYERGIDYDINYQNGTIRRRSSGAIESGQWVLADFTADTGGVNDDVIENSIEEANNQVLAFIDSIYHESTDRLLVDAETYMSVSIICKIRGMKSISPASVKNDGKDAMSWAALSEMYRKQAYDILLKYAGAIGSFNTPSKA
jgi:hypothetical protein